MSVVVRGATLAGMAAAARLARLGHQVTLVTEGSPLGGRWAAHPVSDDGPAADAMPQVVTLTAAWRDLFKKSGAHLQTELNRSRLELAPAPAPQHLLPDGTSLELPTGRGEQFRAVKHAFGLKAEQGWRNLLDGLDGAWNAYRRHALEGVRPVTAKGDRSRLWLDRSLGDVSEGLGPALGRIVTDLGHSPTSPALAAIPLHVEQAFGRWQLTGEDAVPRSPVTLIGLLVARLQERGVQVVEHDDRPHDMDCRPQLPRGGWLHRSVAPAPAPLVCNKFDDQGTGARVQEVVDHTGGQPVTTWSRPVAGGYLSTIHDHTRSKPDPAWGLATLSARDWLRRVPISSATGGIRASASSPAGPAPWAELSSAALGVYELHEKLSGKDSRPTNKDFRLPRLPR